MRGIVQINGRGGENTILDCLLSNKGKQEEKRMITNKTGNLKKRPTFYLLLCGVMLLSLFVETQVANSAPPRGIAVETFAKIELESNPQCWTVAVSSSNIQYTNSCLGNVTVDIVLTHLDGTQETFVIAYNGRLVFLAGSGNVVHIIREQ